MTTKPSYTPALRFPDFLNDGEWEDYSIEEVFDIRNGYTPSKSKAEYWENGTIPWFRMEDIRANGNILSDSIQHITPEAVKGFGLLPAYSIIVATSATIGEHALITVESLANQRFTYLSKKKSFEERVDMMYFHYYMFVIDEWCKKNTNTGGFLSVNMSAFRQLRIPLPPFPEQRRIAQPLTALDELIAATNEKLEQMKAYKKGLMQKLFPAKGKKLPQLRFKEFEKDGEWEVKKLGEVTKDVNRRNKSNRNLPIYSISNKDGFILQSEQFDGLDSISRGYDTSLYKIVTSNTFAYNPARINVGSIGYSGNIKECLISSLYVCFKTTEDVDDSFLMYFFDTSSFNQSVENNVEGGIRSYLFYENFSKIKIMFPSISEQKRIVSFLKAIDEIIDALSNKFSELERYKIGMMQKMFPIIK